MGYRAVMAHRNRGRSPGSSPLTTADLVVMALLHEGPRHGYDIAAELERRDVRDWASVSRAQVYYSIAKLLRTGACEESGGSGEAPDTARRVVRLTEAGKRAYGQALAAPEWREWRDVYGIVTWASLVMHLDTATRSALAARRAAFLREELARESDTIGRLSTGDPGRAEAARSIVRLGMDMMRLELEWLDGAGKEPSRRSGP